MVLLSWVDVPRSNQPFRQISDFPLKQFNGTKNDLLWGQSASRLNSEAEPSIILSDKHRLVGQATNIVSKLGALLAQWTIISIFDFYLLFEFIHFKHLSGAFRDKLNSLGWCHFSINLVVINIDKRLLAHDAGRDGWPLCMSLTYAFLSDHRDVELLITTQEHDRNRVLRISIIILVLYGHHSSIWIHWSDMLTWDKELITVRRASYLKPVVDRTLCAHSLTGAFFTRRELVNLLRH